ncbi:MAG: hypothetical protein K0R15_240 [Clostridiales bacterium]|jgi:hypothetical protein|nr:hypothetical protein [Clostridiales bacterium]
MSKLIGVYIAEKLDGKRYFRASITHKSKHISLGSFELQSAAHKAYLEADAILNGNQYNIKDYSSILKLSFEKWIVLHNYRDNGIYIKNPIYLRSRYFTYYLDFDTELTFDVDDLFYYSTHKIMRRDGYFFVNDYGMQINIRSRYGIRNFSVVGRDYLFIDNNPHNFRYDNIKIINQYLGVQKGMYENVTKYTAKIHINGDYVIGRYKTEDLAAIAYNKAVDTLLANGINKNYTKNYLENLNSEQYLELYNRIRISRKIRDFNNNAPKSLK